MHSRLLFPFFMLLFSACTMAQPEPFHYMLTGTYTGGKSKGIYVFRFNSNDGSAVPVDSVVVANPSYLALSPDERFVYAVSEESSRSGGGKVKAYAFDAANGKLRLLNEQSSMGDHPCYVTVDKTGKWVIVGNYSSGSLAVLPVQADGSLGAATTSIRHSGKGPNAKRQEAPHVHATVLSPDNGFLFVPDLGIDRLKVYQFHAANGALSVPSNSEVVMEGGSGPRHFDWHPNGKWAYLLQELSGTVTAFSYNPAPGLLSPLQTISTLPADFKSSFTSADIHVSPDGRFLYASNRDSSNTIAIFKIDGASGKLQAAGHQSTLGKTPRNFSLDPSGKFLLVANQNSDAIVVFSVDRETGLLKDTGKRIEVGKPVCIKWAKGT